MTPRPSLRQSPKPLIGIYCPGCQRAQQASAHNWESVVESHADHLDMGQDIHPIMQDEDIKIYRRLNLRWPAIGTARSVIGQAMRGAR